MSQGSALKACKHHYPDSSDGTFISIAMARSSQVEVVALLSRFENRRTNGGMASYAETSRAKRSNFTFLKNRACHPETTRRLR